MYTSLEKYDVKILEKGYYCKPDGAYICLVCGAEFKKGEVYRINNRLYHGEKAMQLHVLQQHGERFHYLLENGFSILSMTQKQKEINRLFYEGLSNVEISRQMNVAEDIVEKQRILFKEKAKQAKLVLALYDLFSEKSEEDYSKKASYPL